MNEEEKVTTSAQRSPEEATQSGQPVAERTDEERRAAFMERVALILVIGAIVAILFYVLLYVQIGAWQVLSEGGGLALTLVFLLVARGLARRGKLDAAGYWILFALLVGYGAAELFLASTTLYLTVGGILLIIIVGSIFLPRKWSAWLVTTGLFVTYVFLVNQFEPLPRYDITQSLVLRIFIPGMTASLALVILWQIARAFRIGTIRTRLLIAFVLMVLLLAISISAVSAVMGIRSGEQRAFDNLSVVSSFKETKINDSIEDLHADLDAALSVVTRDIQYARILTSMDDEDISPEVYNDALVKLYPHFLTYIGPTYQFKETFLLDANGEVVLSTDRQQEGTNHSQQAYFQEGLNGQYAALVPDPNYSTRITLVVAQPVIYFGAVYETLGVVAGRASSAALDEIIEDRTGLGQTGETYLVGTDYVALAGPHWEERTQVHSYGIDRAIEDRVDGATKYENHRGDFVFGVYRWLPELQVVLLAEQDQSEALGAIYTTLAINVGVALASVLLAMVASLFITRSIATPLAGLAETATQIAAGDLERTAEVEREDEIGTLAQAFNSMTAQLRWLIGGLEQRVADRTRELEQRSAYLEASAEVGRAATSILETDRLIRQAVELIRERFGLYYVGLFLVDDTGEWAVLLAGTGEAGRAMLARGHRIRVGKGMIGWSVAHAQARVALEAGEDAVRLATAELPHTRSEAALPLRSRGQVLGALTVQHTQPGAFDQDTLVVLQTMADQVAVALDNARLFAESQEALEATRQAYGELGREAWAELLRARPDLGYRSDEHGVTSAGDIWRPEMEQALQEGEIVQGDGADTEVKRPLAVPIKVRGDVIGVLDTYKPGDAGEWTPEEIALVETLTEQLGLALDSARLYQDTQRRAAREQLTREITDKMRSVAGLEDIIQTAVDELSRVLGTSRTFVRLGIAPLSQDDRKNEA
jgi:GAF domain-containing protein/HAMP domain-containing protein